MNKVVFTTESPDVADLRHRLNCPAFYEPVCIRPFILHDFTRMVGYPLKWRLRIEVKDQSIS